LVADVNLAAYKIEWYRAAPKYKFHIDRAAPQRNSVAMLGFVSGSRVLQIQVAPASIHIPFDRRFDAGFAQLQGGTPAWSRLFKRQLPSNNGRASPPWR
jgi:hypothetical protein